MNKTHFKAILVLQWHLLPGNVVTNSNNGSVFVSLRFIPTHVELEYTWTKLCNTEFVFIGLSFSIPFQSSCSLFSFTVCTSHYLSPRGGGGGGERISKDSSWKMNDRCRDPGRTSFLTCVWFGLFFNGRVNFGLSKNWMYRLFRLR